MTDTTDKVAFAAAELNAASDALASAAAEVDALRAELARQTGIAVDHCERADAAEARLAAERKCSDEELDEARAERDAEKARAAAAEQMVVELRALVGRMEAKANAGWLDDDHACVECVGTASLRWVERWTCARHSIDAALSRTEAVAGRWVSVEEHERMLDGVVQMPTFNMVAAERDAAIAARDEAVARLTRCEIEHVAEVGKVAAAERARDEVGIQLAAAQAEIARMRRVVDEARTLMSTPACERLPAERAVCDALRSYDAVPGDALAPVKKVGG